MVLNCAQNIEFIKATEIVDEESNKLVGDILTLLEAIIPSDRQMEATKSNVKKMVWRWNSNVKVKLEELVSSKEVN